MLKSTFAYSHFVSICKCFPISKLVYWKLRSI